MSQASVSYFQKNQVIFYENSTDNNLYKIISGSIAFYKQYGMPDEQLIGISSAPNYFSMMSALSGVPTAYTAVALEKTAVLHLPQSQLETFPKGDPASALALMKTLANELCAADNRLRSLMDELGRIVRDGGETGQKITQLLDNCRAAVDEERILDAFVPPAPIETPTPIETPAPPETSAPPEKDEPVVVVYESAKKNSAMQMPEPYPEGHQGYPGVKRPEDKKYLIQQELTCPHCRQKFTAERVQLSKLIPVRDPSEEKRYDLRVTYNDFELEWHEIVTCPSCYFSSFDQFFREEKSLYKSRYESGLAKLCDSIAIDFYTEKDLDTVFAQHYLALVCAQGFTDSRQITAHVWMNLVRLYHDAGDAALADLAERNALDAYQTVYREVELTPGQEQRLCLTIAGILFARGEKRAAREWAIRVRQGSSDSSAYWTMADQLIQDVREEMDAETK